MSMNQMQALLGAGGGGAPPASDTPQVDTAEQIYVSSLALIKMLKHGASPPLSVALARTQPTPVSPSQSRQWQPVWSGTATLERGLLSRHRSVARPGGTGACWLVHTHAGPC